MKQQVMKFLQAEEGVTMVEYGLIAALIAIVCLVAIGTVGQELNKTFVKIGACLANPSVAACGGGGGGVAP